jgi:Ca2+-binding RTX toxin-like protein
MARRRGTRGDDLLVGTGGRDHIDGRDGDDTIIGGAGDDKLKGGRGDDTINDFTAGAGTADQMDVSAFGFADLADLLASTTDVGSNTEIQLDADDSVTLIGVQKADLHGDDFIF